MASIMGGWDHRSTEWNFQIQTATKELTQIQSQIDAANVRVTIAQTDVQNQQLQINNAQAVQVSLPKTPFARVSGAASLPTGREPRESVAATRVRMAPDFM